MAKTPRRPGSMQPALPGTGGGARFGRRAAASVADIPAATPSDFPLGFKTRVDPDRVLVHIKVPGEPRPKQRPRHTLAKLSDDGRLIQGHTYTPTETERAEELLRWVFLAHRTASGPTPGPVGVALFFKTRHSTADADNLAKLVLDALNGTVIDDDQQVTELHAFCLRKCTDPETDVLVWRSGRRTPAGQ
jgi:Holliday junction resolvase RusA-like endonuclease